MKINIPCPDCGCQTCEAETRAGKKVEIQICRCNDGSGEFDVSVIPADGSEPTYAKHQCSEDELADCLTAEFQIDLNTLDHNCSN